MYIGEVSKKTGLSIKAIRLYEEKGLIKPPTRLGRYRTYSEADIELLNLIAEAKTLGVTLAQLKGVIIYQNGEIDWDRIKTFLIGVKGQLETELTTIANKIQKVDTCIASIDTCSMSLDPPLKGRA